MSGDKDTPGPRPDKGPHADKGLRLDKWLWHARACRTRSAATDLVAGGQVRVNGTATGKPHFKVKPDDVLTFPQGDHIRVWKILSLPPRRIGAPLAAQVYQDLKPPTADNRLTAAAPDAPAPEGRPDRRARQALRTLREKQ